ncbi:MAG: dihydroorotate dehydrogenase electron transfer subunit [Candidatus Heimdallarchaeota archaeon]
MNENIIETVKIKRITTHCIGIKTLEFNLKELNPSNYVAPQPGQFVMIWVPGVDEVPMSLSGSDENGNLAITVKNVGECSSAIHNLKKGDFIGVRGPLGNSFQLPKERSTISFLIGGGFGIAPLKYLASELSKKKFKTIIIEGAKIGEEIIFIDDFNTLDNDYSEIFYCTDDGSYGLEGMASETFKNLIKKRLKSDLANLKVYTCGPELMLFEIFQICEKYNIELEASLERIMRCGCGLCGLCAIDPLGLLVCKDGPIFNSKILREMDDFGKYKRDFTGKKINI